MPNLGAPELLIVLIIVLLLFGVGRLGKIGGELGSGIRAFRDGLKDPDKKEDETPAETPTDQNEGDGNNAQSGETEATQQDSPDSK